MSANFVKLEQQIFRRLNSVVEPAVRRGIASPTLAPAGLIVLGTVGFKSGERRRTPLVRRVAEVFTWYARSGWAFAILVPAKR